MKDLNIIYHIKIKKVVLVHRTGRYRNTRSTYQVAIQFNVLPSSSLTLPLVIFSFSRILASWVWGKKKYRVICSPQSHSFFFYEHKIYRNTEEFTESAEIQNKNDKRSTYEVGLCPPSPFPSRFLWWSPFSPAISFWL